MTLIALLDRHGAIKATVRDTRFLKVRLDEREEACEPVEQAALALATPPYLGEWQIRRTAKRPGSYREGLRASAV